MKHFGKLLRLFTCRTQQFFQVIRPSVGKFPFGKRPDSLIGIEFGCVGRKVFQMQPAMASAKLSKRFALVGPGVVQQYNHGSAQMTQQMAEEQANFGLPDVVEVESVIQP